MKTASYKIINREVGREKEEIVQVNEMVPGTREVKDPIHCFLSSEIRKSRSERMKSENRIKVLSKSRRLRNISLNPSLLRQ